MKHIIVILILFATNSTFAQKIYTRNDSISITQDSVTLKAEPHKGNVQWQKSLDNQNWLNLEGKTTDSLKVKPDVEAMYRAKVTEGTCLPVYSDSARIVFTIPEILTSSALEVIDTSAVCGGSVIRNGGSAITECGICYSLTSNPDTTSTRIKLENELGIFNTKINGLQANTTYYARAYAINNKGITYGEQIQFTTEKTLPFFVSKFVSADIGDTITAPDKTTLIVPAYALQTSGDNSIGGITDDEVPVIPNQNLEVFGNSYKLGFSGDSLLHSVTLTFTLETLPDPIENYVLFMYNGNSYFPIEYTISGNTVTAIIDNINWGNDTIQSLKSTEFLGSGIIIVGLAIKEHPSSDQLGLKQVSISVNGDLKFSDPTLNPDSKILLLIHGILSSPSNAWESFIKDVTLQIPSYSKVWTFGYNSNLSIDENALKLKNALDAQSKEFKVDIVAHSMGGLVSRDMIENHDGAKYVNKLITLGTPNLGSPVAAIRGLIGFIVSLDSYFSLTPLYNYETQGLRDLQNTSNFIQRMKQNGSPPVPYYLIASTNNPKKFWNFNATWVISGLSDGVVAVSSAQGVPDCTTPSSIHIDNGMAHTQMTNINNDVYPQVLAYLRLSTPTLTTNPITAITQTIATSGGNITSNGGSPITASGVCWSTFEDPTTATNFTTDGNTTSYTSNLTGLTANTTYYVWAYATNSAGKGYGNQQTFTTTAASIETGTVTDIDGNVYQTVKIGDQWWMAENLKTTKYNDGTEIPNVTDNTEWAGLTTGAYCWYNNDASYKNPYGALYNWYSVNTGKLAPAGWHVPSDAEWTTLTDFLGGESVAGEKLKEVGINHWCSPNLSNNESGFTAIAGGISGSNGSFGYMGSNGLWWSSTAVSIYDAWYRDIYCGFRSVTRGGYSKYAGYSIRCIKGDITVSIVVPTLTTSTITSITQTSATSGGNITNNGGSPITASGVCWSTTEDPTTATNFTTDGNTSSFTSNLTGLTANTTYYVWAYATNSAGTGYGNQQTFTTTTAAIETGTVTDIDGNVYQTVKIGDQWWMAENLKTTKYSDGTEIPNVTDNTEWTGLTSGAYCWYDNDASYKSPYGALYNWYAVNTGKLAPKGWHVPTYDEWTTLTNYLGGISSEAGGRLKESGYTYWQNPNSGATNETGFTALPGGGRYLNGSYYNIGGSGYWWSSSVYSAGNVWYRKLESINYYLSEDADFKECGFSVRCVRD